MDRLLDEVQMEDGYVKVKVDIIDPKFENSPLPPVSSYDEVADLGDARGKYVQWPRFAIKLLNIETTPQNQDLTQQLEDVTCYEPQFEQPDELNQTQHYHIDPTTIENFDDEFISGAFFPDQHDVHMSERLNAMFDEEPPTPKLSTEQKIQNALLKIENERPEKIRLWAERLKDLFNGKMSIEINVPKEMYPKTSFDIEVESIEYEGMLQFLENGLLEASFLHWCQIYLHNAVFYKLAPEDPKVAYFNIHKITGKECEENFASVKEHLLGVYKLKKGTKYFLAPFFYRAHWVLFIVSPKERSVWILDTISVKAKKDKDDYPLSRAIESSFGSGLTWTMVQCKQQDGSWESGFMVIWFMVQFV
ncbi:uncharacterized protein LOC110918800 [Helianthus annuus]|nr:uncharacterized protein LOC110918800 [Helianthus annuus]